MDKEMNIDNDILIALVEARPVLWDKSLAIFKILDTREAWSQVCCELNEDFKEMESKEKMNLELSLNSPTLYYAGTVTTLQQLVGVSLKIIL
ncbi:unnamed protein product [Acanthoscelides obtectus]|uniref:MADF domain-containing protein n=1 Tax=Acanthoscelides obtectus TaxID=200917 RepID=A0A9P0LP07_ACAOB|nr:unnamed protein product [Acanthoscelides obtectus]CAK1640580.1 hypothetical protein AOBTE_LOCUS11816 [Acanthoscelides obtectus]